MSAIPAQQTANASTAKHHALGHLRVANNKDKARKRSLVTVRVLNRCTNGLNLVGTVVSPGQHDIECYDDQAAGILAQVETQPELIAQARVVYVTALAKELQSDYLDETSWNGTLAELVEVISAKSVDGPIGIALAELLEKTPLSLEASFYEMFGREIKPLDSAEVLAGSEHAEPQREEMDAEVSKAAAANAQALGTALAAALAPIVAALNARIDGLEGKQSGGNQQGGQRR